MSRVLPYLLVGAGGFAGAIARFAIARSVGALADTRFPLATFLINVRGSFLLGALVTAAAARAFPNPEAATLAAGVGFLGAYTTFSTYELETHALLEGRLWSIAGLYTVGSVVAGLTALRAGIAAARNWML
jgi:CrcB protein